MAKQKKKGGGKSPGQQPLSELDIVRKLSRKYPITAAYVSDLLEEGLGALLIVRRRPNGTCILGAYMVDCFCLGVKNTTFRIFPEENLDEVVLQFMKGGTYESADAVHVQNIIYGAVEYAEDLGFSPHKDFDRYTVFILDPVESLPYEEIEFGRDGKPYYIAGPYDDQDFILGRLRDKLGEGNFGYALMDAEGNAYEWSEHDDDEEEDIEEEYVPFTQQRSGWGEMFHFEDRSELYDFSEAEIARELKALPEARRLLAERCIAAGEGFDPARALKAQASQAAAQLGDVPAGDIEALFSAYAAQQAKGYKGSIRAFILSAFIR